MTHTYARLLISKAAYDEITQKLRDAGYDQAFHEDTNNTETIDMDGIGLSIDQAAPELPKLEAILKEMEEAYSTNIFHEVTEKELEDHASLITRASAALGRHLAGVIRRKMMEDDL